MAQSDIDDLYVSQIKPLPHSDRLRLLAAIARDLVQDEGDTRARPRSLLELEGLGARIWQGVDAQAYVDALRDEWDRRP